MINRTNYEEYLLMYLDGELSPTEKSSVEFFLHENPDLKEELEILRQTILQPEEQVSFFDKASLYRKESGISLANYNEYFLLYIDNELNPAEKEAVETFVLQQPALQDEFTLLKQAILPQEHIVFTGKQLLYRREEKRRPVVISLRWASMAAAVMIGIVVLVIFSNNGSNTIEETIAVKPADRNQPATSTVEEVTPTPQKTSPVTEQTAEKHQVATSVNNINSNKKNDQPLNEQVTIPPEPQEVIASNYISQDRGSVTQEPVKTDITNPVQLNGSDRPEMGEEKKLATNLPAVNNIQPAVYTEELETEKDNTVYVGSMQVNPDKVRGFFRKATRFLSSKVKPNDDHDNSKGKVKIASIEMNKSK